MIISVDGYDGTGKTTLAKRISQNYNFGYMYKPIMYMYMEKYNCTYDDALKMVEEEEKILFKRPLDYEKITRYYCDVLLWLKKYEDSHDIVLDRGLLTTYAVAGSQSVEDVFDFYVNNGAMFKGSIYLVADDEERVRRIYNNDPNDPDLKYPTKWRDNNLEEYATTRQLNMYKIDTNNRSLEDVYIEADKFIHDVLSQNEKKDKVKKKIK